MEKHKFYLIQVCQFYTSRKNSTSSGKYFPFPKIQGSPETCKLSVILNGINDLFAGNFMEIV